MEEEKNEVLNEEKVVNNQEGQKNSNGLATASLVLGLVGLLIAAIPCGILAVIFSATSRKNGKSGSATAGLVLGIIDIISGIILTALQVSLF